MAVEKDAKKAKPYPLKTCLISNEKLDADPSMKSFVFVHEGQEIKLCCKNCQKDFKKDSAKYLKKMKEVAAKEAAKLGLKIFTIGIGSPQGEPIPVMDEQGRRTGYKRDKKGEVILSKVDEAMLVLLKGR